MSKKSTPKVQEPGPVGKLERPGGPKTVQERVKFLLNLLEWSIITLTMPGKDKFLSWKVI